MNFFLLSVHHICVLRVIIAAEYSVERNYSTLYRCSVYNTNNIYKSYFERIEFRSGLFLICGIIEVSERCE